MHFKVQPWFHPLGIREVSVVRGVPRFPGPTCDCTTPQWVDLQTPWHFVLSVDIQVVKFANWAIKNSSILFMLFLHITTWFCMKRRVRWPHTAGRWPQQEVKRARRGPVMYTCASSEPAGTWLLHSLTLRAAVVLMLFSFSLPFCSFKYFPSLQALVAICRSN